MPIGKTLAEFEHVHGGEKVHELTKALDQAMQRRRPITLEMPDDNNTIVFGLVGDTQFGNIHEAKDQFVAFYAKMYAAGVRKVLHTGDVLDGHGVYRGQIFDLHAVGWEKQRKYFAATAPQYEGMETYFITGNHDASFKKQVGVDVGEALETERPDWHFLGEDFADMTMQTKSGRTYKVRLGHPGGGTAYAVSYKMQKQIEAMEGGNKPNMLAIGHFHKAEHLPNYRNVDGIQTGCFEWQTPFMAGLGTPAHVGGWIIRATLQPKKVLCNSVSAEFTSFFQVKR